MQLDTDQKGLSVLFKEWQVPLVEKLFRASLTSRDAHEFLAENDVRTSKGLTHNSVSRASVINFLNDLVNQDLLEYDAESGKGGYHRIYKMALTREEFAHRITGQFVDKLLEAFPESKNFPWPRL